MSEDTPRESYVTGYKKPPLKSRFKKGQSGNLRGRPKKLALNFDAALERALNDYVVINENGKRKKILKVQAAAIQLANKAASGDLRAILALQNSGALSVHVKAKEMLELSAKEIEMESARSRARLRQKLLRPADCENDDISSDLKN